MTDKRVPALTELTVAADGDIFYVVDVSDTTDHASGTSKFITKTNFASSSTGISNRERVAATSFSGSSGDAGRTYTLTTAPGGKEIVAVGGVGGALTVLDPTGGYTIATKLITIVGTLFDDEVVIVWK